MQKTLSIGEKKPGKVIRMRDGKKSVDGGNDHKIVFREDPRESIHSLKAATIQSMKSTQDLKRTLERDLDLE